MINIDIKSSNMPKRCAAFQCRGNYAWNHILEQSVFQQTKKSEIGG